MKSRKKPFLQTMRWKRWIDALILNNVGVSKRLQMFEMDWNENPLLVEITPPPYYPKEQG